MATKPAASSLFSSLSFFFSPGLVIYGAPRSAGGQPVSHRGLEVTAAATGSGTGAVIIPDSSLQAFSCAAQPVAESAAPILFYFLSPSLIILLKQLLVFVGREGFSFMWKLFRLGKVWSSGRVCRAWNFCYWLC